MSVYKRIELFWKEHPLTTILFLAVFFRLLATIFARGWGMLDDHFLVIESAQSWVDGQDYNNWLPGSPLNTGPTGHNFFYPGIHFLLFSFFKLIHFNDPQMKMMVVRFLHAAWSMITVYFGYKITLKAGGLKAARLSGLLLAILWFMPWVSVRNMVEVVCIPFLVLAVWTLIRKPDNHLRLSDFLVAGLFLGLAFNIRTQTALFSIGLGLVILFRGKWKEVILMTLGAIIPIVIIQGTIDLIIWGIPFAEIFGYFSDNIISATSYFNMPWYNYFLVVLGFLLPPVSFFLFFGYLKSWKKHLILFLPVALFFIFHSIFPNKQERFILPVLPFIIISGSIGWIEFTGTTSLSQLTKRILQGCWIFFWVINIVALVTITFVYSKKARVETMVYLSKYKNINQLLVADAGNNPELFPRFYLGQWPHIYDELYGRETTDSLLIRASKVTFQKQPRFILISSENDVQQEVYNVRKSFPFIVYETTIEPGFIDRLVRWLNPVNKNRTVYIYRNTLFFPRRAE
jgi:4-amino-4-deoxy-L-arabinose transferase-like glycosyltransferase